MAKIKYRVGNLKIGKDTLIINMGSATNCPSKVLGLCKVPKCYALKAEIFHPNALPCRNTEEEIWKRLDAFEIAEAIEHIIVSGASRRVTPIRFVRFNESGDLHSIECLEKLIAIATMLPNLVFYTYTHRSDLITNQTYKKLPKNLVLNCSNFKRTGLNTFKVVPEAKVHGMKNFPKVAHIVKKFSDFACGGDCIICGYCKKQHGKVIGVPLH